MSDEKERNFDINGIVTVKGMNNDQFLDAFIDFVDGIGGSFGGGILEVDDDGNPVEQ